MATDPARNKDKCKIIKQKVKSLGLAYFCLFLFIFFYNKDSKIKKSWKLIIQTIKNKRGQAKIRREEEKWEEKDKLEQISS